MTGSRYEPKTGDRVYDTRAGRRGTVTSVHTQGSLLGDAVAVEPEPGELGGHWFTAPKHLRLIDSAVPVHGEVL